MFEENEVLQKEENNEKDRFEPQKRPLKKLAILALNALLISSAVVPVVGCSSQKNKVNSTQNVLKADTPNRLAELEKELGYQSGNIQAAKTTDKNVNDQVVQNKQADDKDKDKDKDQQDQSTVVYHGGGYVSPYYSSYDPLISQYDPIRTSRATTLTSTLRSVSSPKTSVSIAKAGGAEVKGTSRISSGGRTAARSSSVRASGVRTGSARVGGIRASGGIGG